MNDEATTQEQTEPQDLSEALKAYQQQNQGMVEASVSDGETDTGTEDTSSEQQQRTEEQEATEQPVQSEGYDSAGGFTVSNESVDYDAWRKAEVEAINKEAINQANEKFKELGIKKFGINDLYQRNEQTGEVTFTNPDNPRQPFTSRAQAQDWINSFNQQVDLEFRKLAYEKQKEVYESKQPMLRMIEFAPTYDRMSDDEKVVFDSIVEPYAINNDKGEPVGFSCDLDAAAVQAAKIVSNFSTRITQGMQQTQQQPQQQPVQTGPALDMKGSRTNETPKPSEPKNLAEAMEMYMKKGNK